jgi:hypothetical protein
MPGIRNVQVTGRSRHKAWADLDLRCVDIHLIKR